MRFEPLDVADHVNQGQTLPKHLYTDSEVFEYEKEAIFRREWLPVARFDQLPNSGDYLTYDLFGDEIVVIRDTSGTVNAFPMSACIVAVRSCKTEVILTQT